MAYRQRKTKGSYSSRSGGYNKRRTVARKSTTRRRSTGGRAQTLRIVVEQPQAVSSVMPVNTKAGYKAVF